MGSGLLQMVGEMVMMFKANPPHKLLVDHLSPT